MTLEGDARPFSKEAQLARGPKRPKRLVASKKRWTEIAARKQGPCRGCGGPAPNQLAHLIGRGQLGPDSEWNIVPLCQTCHPLFDGHHKPTCRKVALSLTDQEYAGLVNWGGEGVIERRFGIRFT